MGRRVATSYRERSNVKSVVLDAPLSEKMSCYRCLQCQGLDIDYGSVLLLEISFMTPAVSKTARKQIFIPLHLHPWDIHRNLKSAVCTPYWPQFNLHQLSHRLTFWKRHSAEQSRHMVINVKVKFIYPTKYLRFIRPGVNAFAIRRYQHLVRFQYSKHHL
jgi:hypothetical protein